MTALLLQEQKTSRPVFKSAKVYYNDFNAEKRKKRFTQKDHDFNYICKATDPDVPITRNEQDLLANITNMIKSSPIGVAYLTQERLSELTQTGKRQNNVMRKNLKHILISKWRKVVKIDGVVRKKTIIFTLTKDAKSIMDNPQEYYEKVKVGSQVPTSLYKDENNILKNRSTHAQGTNVLPISKIIIPSSYTNNIVEASEKKIVAEVGGNSRRPHATVVQKLNNPPPNQRKKPTNAENKARIYKPKFKQYEQIKPLADHYPLVPEDCDKLQSLSGRDFDLNAMNHILLDMSRKLERMFRSKTQFLAYFGLCLRGEMRQATQINNSGFYIKKNKSEAEIVELTTLAEREKYLNYIETEAIMHVSPENQLRAKLANSLPPTVAYSLLSKLKYFYADGEILEVHLVSAIILSELNQEIILQEANAVGGGYTGVIELEVII